MYKYFFNNTFYKHSYLVSYSLNSLGYLKFPEHFKHHLVKNHFRKNYRISFKVWSQTNPSKVSTYFPILSPILWCSIWSNQLESLALWKSQNVQSRCCLCYCVMLIVKLAKWSKFKVTTTVPPSPLQKKSLSTSSLIRPPNPIRATIYYWFYYPYCLPPMSGVQAGNIFKSGGRTEH